MTVVEQLPELREPTDDDLPVGHIPDDASMDALLRGERPTKALCGADLLGIPTDGTPFRKCETCFDLAEQMGWKPL